MTRFFHIALILLLTGCASYASRSGGSGAPEYDEGALWDDDDDGGGTGEDDDDGTDPEGPRVLELEPEPGSSTHHYRDPIHVRFDMSARGGDIRLFRADGPAVDADVEWSDGWDSVTLRPNSPLSPDTPYEVDIDLGGTQLGFEFSTSTVGLPPEAPEELEGRAYRLDFDDVQWSGDLAGMRALLMDADMPTRWIWQVHQLAAPTVEQGRMYFDFGVADAELNAQNVCAASGRFGDPESDVSRTGAYFRTSPADMTVVIGEDPYEFESAWIDGDFTPTGESLEQVGFSGFLRVDSVDVANGNPPGTTCGLMADVGLPCVQCPSEYGGDCMFLEFDHVRGVWEEALDLVDISQDDVESDAECDGVTPDLGCSVGSDASPASLLWLLPAGLLLRRRRA